MRDKRNSMSLSSDCLLSATVKPIAASGKSHPQSLRSLSRIVQIHKGLTGLWYKEKSVGQAAKSFLGGWSNFSVKAVST